MRSTIARRSGARSAFGVAKDLSEESEDEEGGSCEDSWLAKELELELEK